jgi:hypothetical protein
MEAKSIAVKKETLRDYSVSATGVHVCWISKSRGMWVVRAKNLADLQFTKFAEAKQHALMLAEIELQFN